MLYIPMLRTRCCFSLPAAGSQKPSVTAALTTTISHPMPLVIKCDFFSKKEERKEEKGAKKK